MYENELIIDPLTYEGIANLRGEDPPAPPAEPTVGGLQLNATVEVELLGRGLTAVMEKDGDTLRFLILPTPGDPLNPFTLVQLIEGVNSLLKPFTGKDTTIDAADMLEKIKPYFDLGALNIFLDQIFLYYKKEGGPSTVEYAFSIRLEKAPSEVGGFELGKLNSLAFSLWNTNRPKILGEMHFGSCEALLA